MSDLRPIPDPGETAAERLSRAAALPMRVALATFVTPTDERLRFIRQSGVTDLILWGTTFRGPRQPGGGGCGGQPAHAAAWRADLPNTLTGHFFRSTMAAMETAWVRPNSPEFHHDTVQLATKLHAALTAP